MKSLSAACVSVFGFCVACAGGGGSNTGTAGIVGNFNGQALHPADAISANVSIPVSPPLTSASAGVVAISSHGGLCGLLNANQEPKSSQYLVFEFGILNPATGQLTAPTGPDTFTVFSGTGTPPSNKLALVFYIQTDATCHQVAQENGVSGTVTINTVNNGGYAGAFDVQVRSGSNPIDHVSGSFNAASCSALGPLVTTNPTLTCI